MNKCKCKGQYLNIYPNISHQILPRPTYMSYCMLLLYMCSLKIYLIKLSLISSYLELVLTQCISVWYGNATNQDCKALQRVVRLAERISGSAIPSLQVTYLKCCKSRAVKIIKDSTHPGNHLFRLLPSGKRFRSMMAKTERLRRSFFPQAIRLLNTNPVS